MLGSEHGTRVSHSTTMSAVSPPMARSPSTNLPISFNSADSTLGRHLACRLVQVGVNDVFSIPGEVNLTLLDHLLAEPGLNLVGCCNELNAGYVGDGYARSHGVGSLQKTRIFLTGLELGAEIYVGKIPIEF
ncbi:unnamed protein product [Coffea canephora]|uniref:pyruvate decarboxylase n=1 Tax=Coffea canephora TaxID=49390 RepID=A0A068V6P8_COFCA|nr:unnamed protein product [Coffea canephora]